MKWAANFDGCAPTLNCPGGYGFNYRRLHLTLGPANRALKRINTTYAGLAPRRGESSAMAAGSRGARGAGEVQLSVVVPVYGCADCLVALHERLTASVAR